MKAPILAGAPLVANGNQSFRLLLSSREREFGLGYQSNAAPNGVGATSPAGSFDPYGINRTSRFSLRYHDWGLRNPRGWSPWPWRRTICRWPYNEANSRS